MIGSVERPARTRRCTRARSTSTWAPRTRSRSSTPTAPRARGPFAGDWYTQPKKETDTSSRGARTREVGGVPLSFGTGLGDRAGRGLPAQERVRSRGARPARARHARAGVRYPGAVVRAPERPWRDDFPLDVLQGSLHAAEHGQIAVLPLIAMCDRWDIGGLSTAFHAQTGRPRSSSTTGTLAAWASRAGLRAFERLVADALRLISECPCQSGCPSCVQSPKCGNLNEPLNKHGAVELLTAPARLSATAQAEALVRRPVTVDARSLPRPGRRRPRACARPRVGRRPGGATPRPRARAAVEPRRRRPAYARKQAAPARGPSGAGERARRARLLSSRCSRARLFLHGAPARVTFRIAAAARCGVRSPDTGRRRKPPHDRAGAAAAGRTQSGPAHGAPRSGTLPQGSYSCASRRGTARPAPAQPRGHQLDRGARVPPPPLPDRRRVLLRRRGRPLRRAARGPSAPGPGPGGRRGHAGRGPARGQGQGGRSTRPGAPATTWCSTAPARTATTSSCTSAPARSPCGRPAGAHRPADRRGRATPGVPSGPTCTSRSGPGAAGTRGGSRSTRCRCCGPGRAKATNSGRPPPRPPHGSRTTGR